MEHGLGKLKVGGIFVRHSHITMVRMLGAQLFWLCACCLGAVQRWDLEIETPDGYNHPMQLMIDDDKDPTAQINHFCKANAVEPDACTTLHHAVHTLLR